MWKFTFFYENAFQVCFPSKKQKCFIYLLEQHYCKPSALQQQIPCNNSETIKTSEWLLMQVRSGLLIWIKTYTSEHSIEEAMRKRVPFVGLIIMRLPSVFNNRQSFRGAFLLRSICQNDRMEMRKPNKWTNTPEKKENCHGRKCEFLRSHKSPSAFEWGTLVCYSHSTIMFFASNLKNESYIFVRLIPVERRLSMHARANFNFPVNNFNK